MTPTRREFLRQTGLVSIATTLGFVPVPASASSLGKQHFDFGNPEKIRFHYGVTPSMQQLSEGGIFITDYCRWYGLEIRDAVFLEDGTLMIRPQEDFGAQSYGIEILSSFEDPINLRPLIPTEIRAGYRGPAQHRVRYKVTDEHKPIDQGSKFEFENHGIQLYTQFVPTVALEFYHFVPTIMVQKSKEGTQYVALYSGGPNKIESRGTVGPTSTLEFKADREYEMAIEVRDGIDPEKDTPRVSIWVAEDGRDRRYLAEDVSLLPCDPSYIRSWNDLFFDVEFSIADPSISYNPDYIPDDDNAWGIVREWIPEPFGTLVRPSIFSGHRKQVPVIYYDGHTKAATVSITDIFIESPSIPGDTCINDYQIHDTGK